MKMFNLKIIPSAGKELLKIPKKDREKILYKLDSLQENPFPPGYKKLIGGGNNYRIRQGNYRILYTIEKKILLIEVIAIGHRKNIYK